MATRRRKTKRRVRKTRRTIKKKAGKKKGTGRKGAFGGYTINFQGCNDTLAKVFGSRPIAPSAMTKKLWAYVKSHRLNVA